jgi:galactose oxidase-like protein
VSEKLWLPWKSLMKPTVNTRFSFVRLASLAAGISAAFAPIDSALSAPPGDDWVELQTQTAGPGTFYHAMAQGQQLGVVLYGGVGNYSGTWIFSNGNWQQVFPTTNPGPRYGHTMCYDPNRNVVVLFGGWYEGYLGDTWEWDGVDWTQKITANTPGSRDVSQMAFDPVSGRVVLFGGQTGGGLAESDYVNDTWTYDGADWRLEQPSHAPSPRQCHSMASTPTGILLFGGFNYSVKPYEVDPASNGQLYEDTWLWDGVARDWVQLSPSSSPPPTFGASAAYDSFTGNVVLFGGSWANWVGCELDTTWLWDGNTWTQAFPDHRPPARSGPVLVSDPSGGVLVFAGYNPTNGFGFSDSWQFGGQPQPPIVANAKANKIAIAKAKAEARAEAKAKAKAKAEAKAQARAEAKAIAKAKKAQKNQPD